MGVYKYALTLRGEWRFSVATHLGLLPETLTMLDSMVGAVSLSDAASAKSPLLRWLPAVPDTLPYSLTATGVAISRRDSAMNSAVVDRRSPKDRHRDLMFTIDPATAAGKQPAS